MKKIHKIFIVLLFMMLLATAVFFLLTINKKSTLKSINSVQSGSDRKISVIVVPHHDLVASQRKSFLESLNLKNTNKVVLISPNHSNSGSSAILTTNQIWNLNSTKVYPDQKGVDSLVNDKKAVLDESAFSSEHGITNILPDISESFPDAQIVPIIIWQNTKESAVDGLMDGLSEICNENCLMIASIDFSHYQPGALAELHDDMSIRALKNQDETLAYQAEVDSNQTLAMAIGWAKKKNTNNFNMHLNTNSGKLQNSGDIESTSYVMGYYDDQSTETLKNESMTFMFAGDVMFDRGIDYSFRGDNLIDVMSNLGDRVFWGTDISMVNNEGPISDVSIPVDNTINNLIFNFPPKSIDVLKWMHINAVSLANNHSLNDGRAGIERTRQLLANKEIIAIGDESQFGDFSIKRFDNGSAKISVIAINVLETKTNLEKIIQSEKEAGARVVIFPHWGTEYEKKHNFEQEKLAHQWIDYGADLIIGSHPHVVEDAEMYKNRPIFYSMGNLLFDQNFSEETQKGLIVAGRFTNKELDLVLLPTVSKKFKPELLRGAEKETEINKFRSELGIENCFENYECGKIKIQL